jgi:Zn-dependent membrane protease YugP
LINEGIIVIQQAVDLVNFILTTYSLLSLIVIDFAILVLFHICTLIVVEIRKAGRNKEVFERKDYEHKQEGKVHNLILECI